jgi:DNA-binding phage protein
MTKFYYLEGIKMVRVKTLRRQKRSLRGISNMKLKTREGLRRYSPTERLLDEEFIAKAVWECLKNNDHEGVVEIIQAHMRAVNKTTAAQDSDLPRSTLYNAYKGKNPTVKTLAKMVHCFA